MHAVRLQAIRRRTEQARKRSQGALELTTLLRLDLQMSKHTHDAVIKAISYTTTEKPASRIKAESRFSNSHATRAREDKDSSRKHDS